RPVAGWKLRYADLTDQVLVELCVGPLRADRCQPGFHRVEHVLATSHQGEVRKPVVGLAAIEVVHLQTSRDRPMDGFPDDPMGVLMLGVAARNPHIAVRARVSDGLAPSSVDDSSARPDDY